MSRSLLTTAALLSLLFAVCIGFIRAQPNDDGELRAFLTPPEGCPMPCLMGIRPGVTTREEAIAILEAHTWIGEVSYPQTESIIWQWNDLQPPALNPVQGDFAGYIRLNGDNIVLGITVPTRLRFGDISLLFDKPQLFDQRTIRVDGIDYTRSRFCIGNPPFYWHTPASIFAWDSSQFGGMRLGPITDCL